MKKHLGKAKASLIIGFVFVSTLLAIVPSTSAKLLTYNAVLSLSYDADAVNNAVFQPDGAPYNIPINIKFKVEIPPIFISNLALRLIFLQTMIITSASVKITVLNPPTWAAVSINPSPQYVDINNTFSEAQAILSIAAHADAPSEGFSLNLKAETDSLLNGHVASQVASLDIVFKPGYIPLIDVYTENPTRIVGPQETVTFPIKITNLGNKQTLVTARIINYPNGWSPLLSQSQITIASVKEGNNVGYLSFSITPPYGMGWHNELETITLEFTPQFSPPSGNISNNIGTPVPFQVTVRNRGFSTPGFEVAGLFLAVLGTVAITMIKKQRNKQN